MNVAENVSEALHRWAQSAPGELALIENERGTSYRDLDNAVWRVCAALRKAGLGPGAVVAVTGDGGALLQLAISLALARIGAVQTALSLGDGIERHRAIVRIARISSIVTAIPGIEALGLNVIRPDPAWLDPRSPVPSADIAPGGDAIWLINHSSGTTGRPKAMAISHAMEAARMALQPPEFACRPGERFMSLTPMEFWIGRSRAIRCLSEGGTVVAPPAGSSVVDLFPTIDRHDVTHVTCTPTNLDRLIPHLPDDRPRFPRLRMVRVSSAALPKRVLSETCRRMNPNVYTNYGANEAGSFTVATPELLARDPDTAGTISPGIDFQLVDERGNVVGIGEVGHVRARTPGMIKGYLGDEEASKAAFRGGWFYPGDLATIDADGLVRVMGRSDDMLNFDGMLLSPQEIEDVVLRHPAVIDAAAFRIPSERHQDVPAAAVVLREPVDLEAIRRYCRDRLGGRSPLVVIQFTQLPRNAIGKVVRQELTRMALAELERIGQATG